MKKLSIFVAMLAGFVLAAAPAAVKVTDYKPGKNDATAALQAAINSGAAKVIVDYPGFDYIVDELTLRSDLELVFADKVVVRAMPGKFTARSASLFTGRSCKNVIIRGEGNATLQMLKKDYADPAKYVHSEWRHGIRFYGSKNIVIRDITIKSSGGDGIYVGATCEDMLIDNVTCLDHHRQGISVISAKNLTIRNSRFNTTGGTPPAAGIDLEPNNVKQILQNILIENCEFKNNQGGGVVIHTGIRKPLSITVRKCLISGNRAGGIKFYFSPNNKRDYSVTGNVLVEDCIVENNPGPALQISNSEKGMNILFRNITFDNRKSKNYGMIFVSMGEDLSGIKFEKCKLITSKNRVSVFYPHTGVGIKDISGDLTVVTGKKSKKFDFAAFTNANKPDPAARSFEVRSVNMKKLVPVSTAATTKGKPREAFYRGRGIRAVQIVPAPGVYPIRFFLKKIGNGTPRCEVQVVDANGANADSFIIDKAGEYIYNLNAKGTGPYIFEIRNNKHMFSVHSSCTGFGVIADTLVPGCYGKHVYYFQVPAGTKEVKVEFNNPIQEKVNAALITPDGKIAVQKKNIVGGAVLSAKRANVDKEEIWQLSIPYAREDYQFRIGAPAIPILAPHPDQLLLVK